MNNQLDQEFIELPDEEIKEITLTDENISQEQINEMKMLGLPKPALVSQERWYRIQNERIEHSHMIRLAASGIPQWQIAHDLGYDEAHVSKILNTPEIRLKVEQEIKDIYGNDWKATLRDRNAKAIGVADDVMQNGSYKEKAAMARWILEQTVGKASQEIEVKKTSLKEIIIKVEQMTQNQLRDVGNNSQNLPKTKDHFDTVIEQIIPKGLVVGKRSSGEGQSK